MRRALLAFLSWRSRGGRRLHLALALSWFLFKAGAAAWWWTHPPDPIGALRRHAGPLASVTRAPLSGGLERWTLTDSRGRTVHATWRPGPAGSAPWTVVLLGGLRTGERAASLVPDSIPVNVLALDWPWSGPLRMSPLEFLVRVPGIRSSLLRTPGALALGVEAARLAGPSTPVALMGVSLGVAPAVAALRLAHVDAVLLADGGAALDRLLAYQMRRSLAWPASSAPVSSFGGAIGARLLAPLEPALHGEAALRTPVLLLEPGSDSRIPEECRTRLRATFPHATVHVQARDHVRARKSPAIAAIAGDSYAWLAAKRAAGGVSSPVSGTDRR